MIHATQGRMPGLEWWQLAALRLRPMRRGCDGQAKIHFIDGQANSNNIEVLGGQGSLVAPEPQQEPQRKRTARRPLPTSRRAGSPWALVVAVAWCGCVRRAVVRLRLVCCLSVRSEGEAAGTAQASGEPPWVLGGITNGDRGGTMGSCIAASTEKHGLLQGSDALLHHLEPAPAMGVARHDALARQRFQAPRHGFPGLVQRVRNFLDGGRPP